MFGFINKIFSNDNINTINNEKTFWTLEKFSNQNMKLPVDENLVWESRQGNKQIENTPNKKKLSISELNHLSIVVYI